MSSGLVFDDIFRNLFRKNSLNKHEEVVYTYFTKKVNTKIYIYRGSLQYFYWKKGYHESLDAVRPHFNYEQNKMRQYMSTILIWDTENEVIKEN